MTEIENAFIELYEHALACEILGFEGADEYERIYTALKESLPAAGRTDSPSKQGDVPTREDGRPEAGGDMPGEIWVLPYNPHDTSGVHHATEWYEKGYIKYIRADKYEAAVALIEKLEEKLGKIACRPIGGKTEDYFCSVSLQDAAKEALATVREWRERC